MKFGITDVHERLAEESLVHIGSIEILLYIKLKSILSVSANGFLIKWTVSYSRREISASLSYVQ
jgi:hypothetical protein